VPRARRRFAPIVFAMLATVAVMASPTLSQTARATVDPTCQGQPATIVGTDGPDYIVGTKKADVISAGDGDDTIRGFKGNDIICAGAGDDLVNGGLGNDQIFGQAGNDELQMSDPVLYCSTSESLEQFDPFAVETAYQDPASPAWQDCNPANGPTPHRVTIPDGGTKNFLINVSIPDGFANLARDINVRVYVNAPVVNGVPDPCQITLGMQSPAILNPPAKISNPLAGGTCNKTGTDLNGTSFDSEAIINFKKINSTLGEPDAKTRAMNGRFHPSGSLDTNYRNKPVCSNDLSDCLWKLNIGDNLADGHTGSISWWALEINYGQSASDGSDVVTCGTGANDTLDYTARNKNLSIDLGDGLADNGQSSEKDNLGGDNANRCEWLYTGYGNDTLTGNSVYNDIRGGGGNDVITGLGGNDRFRGGIGNDKEYGGDGNDKLDGNDGVDLSDGGPGNDTCLNSETKISCEY
jgi:Ca2+-binding RTX toxin-like protein